jgi:dimethylhistidine N-methyltransferase
MPAFAVLKTEFVRDVRDGLSRTGQKELNPRYFYDDVGSALFDAITFLPEYGLTRADTRLLQLHAGEMVARLGRVSVVVELGSGSGSKTGGILSKLAAANPITYYPIDVSASALQRCSVELRQLDSVTVVPIAAAFLDGLHQAVRLRDKGLPLVVLFLGSTIGNFAPDAAERLLSQIRRLLLPGDALYLSTDLEKDTARMIAAYDDPAGVTAAFNLNLLARINRELEGSFVLSQFRHEVRYNEHEHRIEMHVRSLMAQRVTIGGDFAVDFAQGETIRTECSYKFSSDGVAGLATRSGFTCEAQWVDSEWPFAQSLLRVMQV